MLSILEKKNFIIDSYKLLGAKDVTKEDLEKLQTGIQKANFWLAEFVSEKKALGEAFEKEVADIKLEGLNFPEDMLNALQEKSMLVDKLSAKALEEYNRSKEGYLEVAEKHKIGWGSLKDPIDEMINTQKEVRETQEKILEFMKKTQLAAQEKRSFIELKKKLDALLLKSGDFLRQLDKAFSDPRTFTHVPDDVAGDFKKLFEKLKELDSKIKENSAKIESFSGTLNYLFGDVNGDGKIDQADYHYLNNYITRPRYSPQAKEAWEKLDRIAGDLDGDGFISLIDLELMRERIFGGRKSFPVDPKNKRGDMNGDGEVDRFDSAMMKKALEVEGKLRGAWGRVADIDGNGTLDGHDWEAYNNLRLETEKMREEKKEQIHRTTTPPGQTENISDDQTTPTGSPFEVK